MNKSWKAAIVVAALAVAGVALKASDPVGVYARIDRVVLEPNAQEPMDVQLWGAFSVAIPRTATGQQPRPDDAFGTVAYGNVYGPVQNGYLYYTCPRTQERTCQAEWRDLLSVAGKSEIVGFGARWTPAGRVRAASEKPASPDLYTLNVGVVKIGTYGNAGVSAYADLVRALAPAPVVKGR
jgi:hypothetical protein